ncbi:hypothetical protein BpHYR1_000553, partial [Brachionus plicatilis]
NANNHRQSSSEKGRKANKIRGQKDSRREGKGKRNG